MKDIKTLLINVEKYFPLKLFPWTYVIADY